MRYVMYVVHVADLAEVKVTTGGATPANADYRLTLTTLTSNVAVSHTCNNNIMRQIKKNIVASQFATNRQVQHHRFVDRRNLGNQLGS